MAKRNHITTILTAAVGALAVTAIWTSGVVAQDRPSSNVALLATNEFGKPLVADVSVRAFEETAAGLREVVIENERLPTIFGFGRYHLEIRMGRSHIKRRVVHLTDGMTNVWVTPPADLSGKIAGYGPYEIHGKVIGDPRGSDELWVKLLSIPAFEELGDRRLGDEKVFSFTNLRIGVYFVMEWGIHLTQVTPRCSMRRCGGLSA